MIRSNSSRFDWPRLASAGDAVEFTRSDPGWQAGSPWEEDQFWNFWIREQINHKLVGSLGWGGTSSTRLTGLARVTDSLLHSCSNIPTPSLPVLEATLPTIPTPEEYSGTKSP